MFARHKSTHWAARVAVATLAAGVVALAGSGSALAKDGKGVSPKADAPRGEVPSGSASIGRGDRIAWLKDNKGGDGAPVVHFTLTYANGKALTAYCIDFQHAADHTGNQYDPGQWDESTVKNLPKIQWVLSNSYPHLDSAKILSAAGASSTGVADPDFVAYLGTQTAIWHYSDGVEITGNDPHHAGGKNLSDAEYAAATKVREYLIKKATDAPEPTSPAVSLSPQQATGYAGGNAGPFTVNANGGVDKLSLTPSNGATVVDKNGKPLSDIKNGTQFWLHTPAGSTGSVTVTANGAGAIPTGQVYLAKNGKFKFQKLILADTGTRQVSSSATATLTASPSPSPSSAAPSSPAASPSPSGTAAGGLPVTGTSLPIIIGAAVVLLGGGAAVVVLARRRRMTT